MDPGGLVPSTLQFRATIALLVVGLALTVWHLAAWPQFPSPAPLAIVVPPPTPTALPPLNEAPAGGAVPEPSATAAAEPGAAPATTTVPATLPPAATPGPATPTPTPTRAPGPPSRYVVVGGDTLLGIAIEHDTTVAALLAANDLTIDSILRIGQELVIP